MTNCLFCRIVAGTAPSKKLYEDDDLVAIEDIDPQAPLHALLIPRRHIATLNDLSPADDELVGKLIRGAAAIAKQRGLAERGYRTLFNCNRDAQQSVFHVHLHLLAGRKFTWPPG